MKYDNFKGASIKQVEAVMLIIPGPEGEGLTYEEASRELGISKASFIERIKRFKARCPGAWDEIESMWRAVSRGRGSFENPISLNDIDESKIKDRF